MELQSYTKFSALILSDFKKIILCDFLTNIITKIMPKEFRKIANTYPTRTTSHPQRPLVARRQREP